MTNRGLRHSKQGGLLRLLVSLLVLAGLPGWCEGPPTAPLDPAKAVTRELRAGEAHAYALKLEAGALVRVTALQKGIDLVLTAFGPDGKKLVEIDGPSGAYGPETLTLTALAEGVHTFDVRPLEPGVPAGRYELKVDALLAPETARKYAKVALEPRELNRLLGTYEVAPGHRVTLNPISGLGGEVGLLFTDLKTRTARLLHPRSATSFFAGDSVQGDFPVAMELEMLPEGLRFQWKGGPSKVARRLPCRTEEVSFRNGAVDLRGTLILPEGKGPFPTVVYAHGSGPLRRESLYGASFYPMGVAYFSFDKRGTGQSTGDWRTASLEELAGDVLAGIRCLQARPDIDGSRVGVIGISQGGWVGSIAARSSDVKFMVIHSGSGVSVAENIVHEQRSQMLAAGLSEAQVAAGTDFNRRTGRMATEGRPWEEIHALFEAVKAEPFAGFAFPAALSKENTNWEWFRKNGDVDTGQILKQVRCPVLWFLADLDTQVPTAKSEPRLRQALKEAGNRDGSIKVMKNASHMLLETRPELHGADLGRFVPGFWGVMERWVKLHTR
jgi:alpha-beta hydrolase superfamily lysophospholipase